MGIFLAALVLRLVPVLLSRSLGIGLDDMFQYDMLARSLASGNGFRWYAADDLKLLEPFVHFDLSSVDYDPIRGVETSFRAPLYPAFLALVYSLVGAGPNRFFAARLAQAVLLGAPLAPLTYFVSKKIIPENERVAKISAWVVAAYPILLAYPLGLGTENLFFFLLLSSFLFLLKFADQSSTNPNLASRNTQHAIQNTHHVPPTTHNSSFILHPSSLLAGFLLGLTSLTRSVILPFAALAILWLWFVLKQKRGALLAAFALILTVSPWIVRNSLLHHKLTGIETSMGYNLYLGYHPQGNGSFVFGPSLDLLTILDDAERDRIGTQKAVEFIQAQPERFLPLALNRLGFFFGLEKRVLMYFYSNNLVGYLPPPLLLTLFAVIVLPFIFVSLSASFGASLLNWNPQTCLLALLFVCYLLPHIFILSEDRFHLALVPFLAILAARVWTGGFRELAARWQASRAGKLAVSLAVVAAFLLLLNWGLEISRDADKIAQLLGPDGNQLYFSY